MWFLSDVCKNKKGMKRDFKDSEGWRGTFKDSWKTNGSCLFDSSHSDVYMRLKYFAQGGLPGLLRCWGWVLVCEDSPEWSRKQAGQSELLCEIKTRTGLFCFDSQSCCSTRKNRRTDSTGYFFVFYSYYGSVGSFQETVPVTHEGNVRNHYAALSINYLN